MVELAKIIVHKTTGHCLLRRRIPARAKKSCCVSVEFDDPVWDGLVKTVVFRGNGKKIAEFDGEIAIVPWEVLENPGPSLWFGILGSDPDTGLQLPLIEVCIGTIEESTDPDADPGTDPTLPIWAQLKQDVEELKKGGTGGGGAKSDWNAAEGEPGHVLNRTHWTEDDRVELLPETTLSTDDEGFADIAADFTLIAGDVYTVVYNGTAYQCTCVESDGARILANDGINVDTGEGMEFAIVQYTGSTFILSMTPGEVTLSIYHGGEIVHKLNNKYLNLDWLPVLVVDEIFSERTVKTSTFQGFHYGAIGEIPDTVGVYDALEPGQTVILSVNGTSYKASVISNLSGLYIGEFGYQPDPTAPEYVPPIDGKWMISVENASSNAFFVSQEPGTYTIRLSTADGNKIPEEFLPDNIGGINITGASIGQIARISAVDAEGKPTEWEPIDLPNSGGNVNQSAKTAFDAFMDNTDVDYAYDNATGAYYTVIRIYRDRLDGEKQYPFVLFPNDGQNRTTYDLVMQEGYYLAINAGIFHNPRTPDGIVIQNGVVLQNGETTAHPNCKPLTIDGNGTLGYAEYDADANDLVSEGIVSAVVGFMPIVIDYAAVPESEWNSVSHYTSNAQRQIIGQWGCGDYAIITCEGRSNHNSDGWTIAEAQQICMKHGLKFAYNLDGGGSTETMLGKKHINTIYENETGRRVPTFIVFNGKNTFGNAPVIPDNPEPENPEPVETYTTLEYVEFTGTQHINTDIPDSATLGVEAEIVFTDLNTTGGRHFVSGKNSYYVSVNGSATPMAKRCGSAESSLGGEVRLTANANYLVRAFVDDDSVKYGDIVVTASMPAGTNAQGNICIGSYAGSPDTATRHLKAKLYALRFYNSGVLSHNFVPSMRSDGAVGLLDTIGNTFYQSSTSTPLVAGDPADSDEPSVNPDEPTVELLDFDLIEGSVSYKETYIKYWGNHAGAYPKRMQMNPVLVRYDPNYQYTVKMTSSNYCMFPHWLTFDNTTDTFVVDGTKDVVWSGNSSIVGYQRLDGGGEFIIPACDVFFVHLQRNDTADLTDEDKTWLRNNFTVERVKL